MESQYVAAKEKTARLLNKQDSDVGTSTSIDMEDAVALDMPDSEVTSALIDRAPGSGAESVLPPSGSIEPTGSHTKKLLAAGLLFGIPLLYLASNLVRKAYSGSDDDQSDGFTPGATEDSFATSALPHTDAELAVAVTSVATIASLIMPFPWLKRWRKGVESIVKMTASGSAPVYAQIGTSDQAGSASSHQTGSASSLLTVLNPEVLNTAASNLAVSDFSMTLPEISTGMPPSSMWWLKPPLPSEPPSGVLANDISVEQMEADLRLIDSLRIPDLEEILGRQHSDLKKNKPAHRRMKKRQLANTKETTSAVERAVYGLMTTGLPEHMRQEFAAIYTRITDAVKQKEKIANEIGEDAYLLRTTFLVFSSYLKEIVSANQADQGAYYFLNIKIKELIVMADKYDVYIHDLFDVNIDGHTVMRSNGDELTINRDPENIYNAYINYYFPRLAQRQIGPATKIAYACLPENQRNIHFVSVADLLDKKYGDLDTSQFSFYQFLGDNTGFSDDELERLLNPVAGIEFSEFKEIHFEESINAVMQKNIPAHLKYEWEHLSTVEESAQDLATPGMHERNIGLIKKTYRKMAEYLDLIINKGEEGKAAYYYCHMKMKELEVVARNHNVDLFAMMGDELGRDIPIIRSQPDLAQLNRNPTDIYNAYIARYFPLLKDRDVHGGDMIAYSLLPHNTRNIHFVSVADLLEGKASHVEWSKLSFYNFKGYNKGIPDPQLDALIASASGPQFNEFKKQYSLEYERLSALLEQSLAAMEHTPMGFQRESLRSELSSHVNLGIDIEPLFSQALPTPTLRNNILLFAASISIVGLIENNPDFEGMVLSNLMETDFIYQYKDRNGVLHVDTAKLDHILINRTGGSEKTDLAITSQADVQVRWPKFFSQRQIAILSEEMQKLQEVALNLGKDKVKEMEKKMNAQAALWLAMPPLSILLDQIVEKVCTIEKVPRIKLEDKLSFLYDDKPLLSGGSFDLGLKDPVRVEFSVMDILLGKKRLYERDEGLLSLKSITLPSGFQGTEQQLLRLVEALSKYDVQNELMNKWRSYLTDELAFKAFSELRRIVEPSKPRANWYAWEFKNNPNMLLYIKNPKVTRTPFVNKDGQFRSRISLEDPDGCEVEILFRLSGNRYSYKDVSTLNAAVETDEHLKADLASHGDVEKGVNIGNMELNHVRYEHESDRGLFKRIVEKGISNGDKYVHSVTEVKLHEVLDGFALVGYVAFIPSMFVSFPVALGLGLLYGVVPKLLQSVIAVREDEIAQLQYDAFKNLLMEILGGAAGAAVGKATTKLVKLSVKTYQRNVKGVNAGVKGIGNGQIATKGLKAKKCESMGAPLAICEIIDFDDAFKMVEKEPLIASSVGSSIQKKSFEAIEKRVINVLDKLNSLVLEVAKYPAQAELDALLPTEAYLAARGFTSIRYSVVSHWPSNINSPPHIVVFFTFNNQRYVIDLARYVSVAGDRPRANSIVMDETQWSQHYASAQSSTIMLYKDFNRRQAAINFFNMLFPRQRSAATEPSPAVAI